MCKICDGEGCLNCDRMTSEFTFCSDCGCDECNCMYKTSEEKIEEIQDWLDCHPKKSKDRNYKLREMAQLKDHVHLMKLKKEVANGNKN